VHSHPHTHVIGIDHGDPAAHDRDHDGAADHGPGHDDGHSHGLIDRSILRSRDGVRTVAISLGVLGLTAAMQVVGVSAISASGGVQIGAAFTKVHGVSYQGFARFK
jgi:hypothetical protein